MPAMKSTDHAEIDQRAPGLAGQSPLLVLMYHNIISNDDRYRELSPSVTSYFVTLSDFAAQLGELLKFGGTRLGVEAVRGFYSIDDDQTDHRISGKRPFFLTFDDGWQEAVDQGGPVLETLGLDGLFFITTDFVGRPHFFTRAQLSRIPAAQFKVGSHARSHRLLSELTTAEVRSELQDSKKFLEDAVGYEVDSLSFPGGATNDRVREIAKEVGYRLLFGSEVRLNSPGDPANAIGRVAVMRTTPISAMRRYAQHRIGRERLRRSLLATPKRVLGLHRYQKLRRLLLGEASGRYTTHEP
jgi:peptidoglycan/xylan/chitin deacetylase (PgdA/CDA1 family)